MSLTENDLYRRTHTHRWITYIAKKYVANMH